MRVLLIGMALGLAGCGDLNLNLNNDPAPVQQAALLGGAVGLAGPDGYCVDVADSKLARGFALLAPCETLGLEGVEAPRSAGIITVQAGRVGTAAVAGSEPALAGFLESDAGAALLSENAERVTVLSTSSSDNKVVVQFEDAGGTQIAGTQDTAWRGFVDIGGRLVTVSTRGLAAQPLGETEGAGLLDAAISAILNANAAES